MNVFHAVSLCDEVTVSRARPRPHGPRIRVSVHGALASHLDRVPLDDDNLAVRAVRLVEAEAGPDAARGPLDVRIDKAIPVAGGMAGGSADAAAALVACDALYGTGLGPDRLTALAADLGSDVPFALLGGTAVGTGRGELLTPLAGTGRFHWVFALSDQGLSTPAVFAEYDRLRPDAPEPAGSPAVTAALADGDARALGAALANDLQEPALTLRPDLRPVLAEGRAAGALGGIVSGSGPTCAFIADGPGTAASIAAALEKSGACTRAVTAHGPVPGAHVI